MKKASAVQQGGGGQGGEGGGGGGGGAGAGGGGDGGDGGVMGSEGERRSVEENTSVHVHVIHVKGTKHQARSSMRMRVPSICACVCLVYMRIRQIPDT
jgi:hypothetical protein